MSKLYKMDETEKKEMNFPIMDNYYSFKREEELLGFAKINMAGTVDIYIFILENKRGNGFGKELFSDVLKILKEEGIPSFPLSFPIENVIMRRIVESYGGIEESRKENLIRYTVFTKNERIS